jgi:gliding motility-associated-like protein
MSIPKNTMRIAALVFCLFSVAQLSAQTQAGLVAFYPFENSNADGAGNTANAFQPALNRSYDCGVIGRALEFSGVNGNAVVMGPANDEFDTEDFTLSFYFKATNQNGIQYLAHKLTSNCKTDGNYFYIRFRPFTRTLNVFLGEGAKTVNLIGEVPKEKCWHHVAVIREGVKVKLYINGVKVQELNTQGRINLSNDGKFIMGNSPCAPVANQAPFEGYLDEVRLYNRSLNDNEAKQLYAVEPDNIVTRDTSIFIGGAVKIKMGPTCNFIFNWSPINGVVSPFDKEPVIQPFDPGIYFYSVNMTDDGGVCVATDSIRITVIDPNTLDCGQVLLPKAFTPNGDGLNETFGISNPFVIQELISFEIYDRWGSRVFGTADPFYRWDGSFQGKKVNSGVMLYKIRYRCKGEEKIATGSVMVMR